MQSSTLCIVFTVLSSCGPGALALRKRFQLNATVGNGYCCCRSGHGGCDVSAAAYTFDENLCCMTIGMPCNSWRNMFGNFKQPSPQGDPNYCDASTRPTAPPKPTPPPQGHGHCCCKDTSCREGATSDSKVIDAVYSPNQNRCCKLKQHACGSWKQTFSGYRTEAPTPDYCNYGTPQDRDFVPAQFNDTTPPENDTDIEYPAGSVGHTLNTYCDFSKHVDHSETDSNAKKAIIQQIVDELDGNSIDTMAKEMFTLYVCVRWTASPEFVAMAEDEMDTEQLERKSIMEHFEDQSFIPLKCTENFKVFNVQEQSESHFDRFEAELGAQQEWYEHEENAALSKRLLKIYEARANSDHQTVESLTGSFDLRAVRRAAETCQGADRGIFINVWEATTEELFADCAATHWWKHKLENWHRAMPFSTFMLPGQLVAEAKPRADEQVMVCFGKRIASQLHRRKDGDHLMTDQQTVGCHGFWDYPMAAKMLRRIIDLWRPPTCQLAAMELEFKVKILEMISDMNERLFDSLPSMLVEDMASYDDWDGQPLQAAGGVGTMQGIWQSIVDRFAGLKGKYSRLGLLLGNTAVKWAVCPLKEITNQTELDHLDSVLGTEDNVARWYARIAYSQHTGEANQLPGERCNGTWAGLPRAKTCSLGEMREDMPEPYKEETFLCPNRPLLPAKQQLEVFKTKVGSCMLRMTPEQQARVNWNYKGHVPIQKQYNKTDNSPTENYQAAMVLESRSAPDAHFGIWRDFVKLGLGCTEREYRMTPQFCTVNVVNDQGNAHNLVTNEEILSSSSGVSSANLGRWFGRRYKGIEAWLTQVSSEFFGQAGARRAKLSKKWFTEAETADLVHSMSFQKQLPNSGGDSKNRDRFDRFAVAVPCPDWDPNRMFDLTYQWSEAAVQLLAAVPEGRVQESVVSLQVRAAGHFRIWETSTTDSETGVTTTMSNHDVHYETWVYSGSEALTTSHALLGSLIGIYDHHDHMNFDASKFKGIASYFVCGPRTQVHDLSATASGASLGSFKQCVNEGIATNQRLREENPGEPFLPEEVVVRMTVDPALACGSKFNGGFPHYHLDHHQHTEAAWQSFRSMVAGCSGQSPPLYDEWTVGNMLGAGMPDNTMQVVLLDPEDLVIAVKSLQ